MIGRTDGHKDDGRTGRQMDGGTDVCKQPAAIPEAQPSIIGWTDGWTVGQTDGQTDGQTN